MISTFRMLRLAPLLRSLGRAARVSILLLLLGAATAAGQSTAVAEATESRPNILFLFGDDQRADTIQAWGNSGINTPNLDELVASGFSFRSTYNFGSNSSVVCIPSRAMVLTGRSWLTNPAPRTMKSVPTLPLKLAQAGYRTFITGKWHNGTKALLRSFDYGTAVFRGGMADHTKVPVEDIRDRELVNPRTGDEFSSKLFADATIEFLNSRVASEEPFFAYVAFTAPHDPRNPPLAYRQPYYQASLPQPVNFMPQHPFNITDLSIRGEMLDEWPRRPEVIRDQLAEYYGLITHLDEQIGRILAALENNDQAENTVVVYAADNGLALGSHGLMAKQSLYEHSAAVPLIIKGPGIPPGSTDALTYLFDLFPTLLGVAGVNPPGGIDGDDLAVLWSDDTEESESWRTSLFLAYKDSIRAVRDDRYKLIAYTRINHRQLFDLETDPDELTNLATRPEHSETRKRLARSMTGWRVRQNDRTLVSPPQAMRFDKDLTGNNREADGHQPEWIKQKYFDPQVTSVQLRRPSTGLNGLNRPTWRLEFRTDVTGVDPSDFQFSGEEVGEATISVTAVEGSQRLFDVSVTSDDSASLAGVTGTLDFSDTYDVKDLDGGTVPRAWPAESERTQTFVTSPAATLPEVSITANAESVTEGTQAAFRIALDKAASEALTVAVNVTKGGSALPETSTMSVTVPSGDTSATLGVPTGADQVVEPDTTVTAAVASGTGYVLGSASEASVTVMDDDAATFTVTASPSTVAEGESATLTVELGGGVTFAVDQTLTLTVAGSASGTDYRLTPATLTLAAGASSTTAQLSALDDDEEEGPETATITVSHSGAPIGAVTVTIASVSRDATLSTLSLSGVDIGAFSGDTTAYAASVAQNVASTTVTATASHARATVSMDPGPEVSLAEGANVVTVTVTAEDGTTTTYTVTVTRAGGPLTARFASLPEAHAGSGSVVLRVRFSEPVGTNYLTLRDQSFRVTNGAVRSARRVDGRSDLWEIEIAPSSGADLVVVLPATTDCAAAGAVCTAGGKPLSNRLEATIPGGAESGLPVISVAAVNSRVSEGERVEFRLARTGPATGKLSVGIRWTWSDGSDGLVQRPYFPAGRTSQTAQFTQNDDKVVREDLTVTLTLEDGERYAVSKEAGSAEVVVAENDEAAFALSASPAEVEEGESATIRVGIANGVTFGEDQAITLDFAGGTATKDADYTVQPGSLTLGAGASAVTATVTALVDAEDEGDETITVTAGHGGTVIGPATVTIGGGAAAAALTGRFEGMPETHDGETPFTFELRFSEEIEISYLTLRDTAFTVTGGAVRGARRLAPPSNLGWEITVEPTSDADVSLVLPETTDCAAAGAVCTAGGKPLSNRLEATISGGAESELAVVSVVAVASPVSEGEPAEFRLTRAGPATGKLSVGIRWAFSDGSDDIVQQSHFLAGGTIANPYSRLSNDTVVREDQTVTLMVEDGEGYTVSAEVVVEENDEAEFALSFSPAEVEEGESATVRVGIANGVTFAAEQAITLDFSGGTATRDADYTVPPGSLTLGAGASAVTATVTALVDAEDEGDDRLADGSRLAGRDLALSLSAAPVGVWSDGETAWVADWLGDTVHAYRLSDGSRVGARDIRLAGENLLPVGLWSDGGTLWVADWGERMVAYRLSDGAREPERDIAADGGDADPSGLWSDGDTLLATSWEGAEVRAHELPGAGAEAAVRAGGPGGWTAGVPPIADAALRAAIEAALGGATGAEGLAELEVLEARNRGIRSLAGLEGAVNLKELDLGFNPLEDAGALAKLPSLATQRAGRGRQPHRGPAPAGEADRAPGSAGGPEPHCGSGAARAPAPAGGAGPGAESPSGPARAGGTGAVADAAPGGQRPPGAVSAGRSEGPLGTRPRGQRRRGPGRAVGAHRAFAAGPARQPPGGPAPAARTAVAGLGACRGEPDREPGAPRRPRGADAGGTGRPRDAGWGQPTRRAIPRELVEGCLLRVQAARRASTRRHTRVRCPVQWISGEHDPHPNPDAKHV